MSHSRIKTMKENLMCCIEEQIENIQEADANELGEAIDMLKDLEEALYYSTITEAMLGDKKYDEFEMIEQKTPRESHTHDSRKMYIEAKHNGHDKAAQLRELEKYMQELTQDMVDMI